MIIKLQKLARGRTFLIKLSLFAFCLYSYSCTPPQEAKTRKPFTANKAQMLDSFIRNFRQAFPVPGLAVAVVYNDSVYTTASGISDSTNKAFTVNMPFLAGGVSEPMLAMAVLKLAHEGELNLDAPVTQYLSYFKMGGNSYQKITVRHLLTHTSGIQHYNPMWDAPNNQPNAPEVTTRSIATQMPYFDTPGSRVKRSPYNYDILADVVSKVTHQPFENYIKANVFNDLGMKRSSFKKEANTAMPFRINNWLAYTTQQDTLYPYNRENGGSGGLHTTAKDMAGWMFAILNKGQGVGDVDELLSSQFKTGKTSAVGLGWDIEEQNKEKVYLKGSQYGGFSNQIILIPGKKIGVMVNSNISGDFNPANLSKLIAFWLSGKKLTQPKIPVSMPMSRALAQTGNMADAFKTYGLLKQTHPQGYDFSAAALSQFGTGLLHRVHDKPKALQAFRFCVEQYPASAYAYLTLAEGYIFSKDAKNTRLAITKARLLPDDSGTKASYLTYLLNSLEILEENKS